MRLRCPVCHEPLIRSDEVELCPACLADLTDSDRLAASVVPEELREYDELMRETPAYR